jgi:hypothetical protein
MATENFSLTQFSLFIKTPSHQTQCVQNFSTVSERYVKGDVTFQRAPFQSRLNLQNQQNACQNFNPGASEIKVDGVL